MSVAYFLAIYTIVLGESMPLVAACGLIARLVVAQVEAVGAMRAIDRDLSASVSVEPTSVFVGDRAAVILAAPLSRAVDAPVEIGLVAPPSVNVPERARRTVSFAPGETEESVTCSVKFPTAKRITFGEVDIGIDGHAGSLTESVTLDIDACCLVELPAPEGIYVRHGGKLVGMMFSDHSDDQTGPGPVPHETRQYLPGDTLPQTDWKTATRMNHPYVRELESEPDYLLLLVIGCGSHMNRGPTRRTMLSYARETAFGLVDAAKSHGDPVSTQFVGDDAMEWKLGPSPSSNAYQTVRRRPLSMEPIASPCRPVDASHPVAPEDACEQNRPLDDGSAFAATPRPYLRDNESYASWVSDRPLFDAVRSTYSRSNRQDHFMLVTDDSARAETYRAVAVASKRSGQTSVFLTPTTFFDDTAGAAATDFATGLATFEEFREPLEQLPNVAVYEIAPKSAVTPATARAITTE